MKPAPYADEYSDAMRAAQEGGPAPVGPWNLSPVPRAFRIRQRLPYWFHLTVGIFGGICLTFAVLRCGL